MLSRFSQWICWRVHNQVYLKPDIGLPTYRQLQGCPSIAPSTSEVEDLASNPTTCISLRHFLKPSICLHQRTIRVLWPTATPGVWVRCVDVQLSFTFDQLFAKRPRSHTFFNIDASTTRTRSRIYLPSSAASSRRRPFGKVVRGKPPCAAWRDLHQQCFKWAIASWKVSSARTRDEDYHLNHQILWPLLFLMTNLLEDHVLQWYILRWLCAQAL